MAVYEKFNIFNTDLMSAIHNLQAAGHTIKAMLTNVLPVAGNTVFTDITEIAAGNGYVAGGFDIQNSVVQTGVEAAMFGVDVLITSNTGTVGPFQYVVLYNDTAATKPLIAWYARTSAVTLDGTEGDTFLIDFDQVNGIVDLT
jgi:hypothetical protein